MGFRVQGFGYRRWVWDDLGIEGFGLTGLAATRTFVKREAFANPYGPAKS